MTKKLVRDYYDRIIPTWQLERSEPGLEFFYWLEEKLVEEMNECKDRYFKDVEEWADLVQVIYSMAQIHGFTVDEIEEARVEKHMRLGGFSKRLLLKP